MMVLKSRWLLSASELYPAQPLEIGNIDDETVEASAGRFIRNMPEMSFGQSLDPPGIDQAILPTSLLLFLPDRSVQGNGSDERLFIVKKNIGLRGIHARVYHGRTAGTAPQEKFSNEPATTEGANKATPGWSQELSHSGSPPR
jgi:hypothetical protein